MALHAAIVLEGARIAIVRKVIILDLKQHDSTVILGIAALIITISGAYYILRRKVRVNLANDPREEL